MGRKVCCSDHKGNRKGPWTAEEDQKLINYIQRHGPSNWRTLPKLAGLSRCGKSCRMRWANYLRPDIKRGAFSMHEDLTIIRLHAVIGNKWSAIASHLPGRTDNEIKNHWNTKLRKRLLMMGIDPVTHTSLPTLLGTDNNPLLAHASGSLPSTSTDHILQNQVNQRFVSGPRDDSTENNTSSEGSLQFSDLEKKSEGIKIPIRTDHENHHSTAPSLTKEQPSAFNTQIIDWNSMPILMSSSNPDKNDHLQYCSDKKSQSAASTNSTVGTYSRNKPPLTFSIPAIDFELVYSQKGDKGLAT